VGCGYWGPGLVRNFYENDLVELKYICDLQPERLAKLKKRYPTVIATTQYSDLLNDPELDAIAVATPVDSHYKLAKAALEAGKSVLVEKPMCTTSQQCLDLVATAEDRGLTLMVDHTFVYHPAVRQIKEIIDRGELGKILYFDSTRVNLGLFQSDVNVIWDLAPHDLSMIDFLLGQTPISVSAFGSCHAGNDIEDIAYISLEFEDNLIAHLNVSWLSPVKLRHVMIGGTKKMILFDDLQPAEKIRVYDKGISVTQPTSDENRYHRGAAN
jgi:predicted dehydrogenase